MTNLPKRQKAMFELVKTLDGKILGDVALDQHNRKALYELLRKGLITQKGSPSIVAEFSVLVIV